MKSIQDLYDFFFEKYNGHINRVARSVNIFQINNINYDNELNDTVIEKSFLDIFLLWEKFLEESFLIYLLGNNDLQGIQYVSYVKPVDKNHAYNIVRGTQKYPDWTNIEQVNLLSKIYFENTGPYAILTGNPIELIEIKKIRNKISHISINADEIYKNMLRSMNINDTLNVSEFLMEYKDNDSTYFTHYTEFIKGLVNIICNNNFDSK